MTREEITSSKAYQASKEALKYYNEHYQDKDIDLTDAFEAGAEWADETLIEKACEWLENNVNNYIIIDDYLGKVQPKISSSMFDNFKKAMEG